MGVPQAESEETVVSPTQGLDSARDRQELSGSDQAVFGQPLAAPDTGRSQEPKLPTEDTNDKLSPRNKRQTDAGSKKAPDAQINGGSGGGGGSGVGNSGGGGGVSVTLLTLDADLESRPHSRQHFLPSPRSERDHDMADLKLIRDFQVRRKYGRRPNNARPAKREKAFINLGLSGTRYFNDDPIPNGITSSLDTARTGKSSISSDDPGRLQNGTTPAAPSVGKSKLDDDRTSVDSKDIQSSTTSLPPLSPGGVKNGVRTESTFYSSRYSSGHSPSLLVNHFGFSTIRPDTFSGMQRPRKLRLASTANDDLIKELEQHAQKQILACQNMGYTHRGSRAAESVLSLKHTVSPSAFHPSSFFTRHVPKEERGSRSGTPSGLVEVEEKPKRRSTHPTPAGKLSMPRLLVPDRQEQASRRAALPTVNGNSLQVMLAHSHAK